jgi:hypothetical protein
MTVYVQLDGRQGRYYFSFCHHVQTHQEPFTLSTVGTGVSRRELEADLYLVLKMHEAPLLP